MAIERISKAIYSGYMRKMDGSRTSLKPDAKDRIMKSNHIKRIFLFCLPIVLPLPAQAVIIDGTFKGKVLSVSDNGDNNNPYYVDFFSENLEGSGFTGSFWYDTELAPANMGSTGQWRYSENTDWFGVTFYVDGKTLNADNIPDGSTQASTLELHTISDPNGYTGIRDFTTEHFGVREFVTATKEGYISEQSAGISFLEQIIPLLNGNSLIQNFTWYDTGEHYDNWDDIPGLALYFNYNSDPEQLINAGLAARLSEITVKPRQINVTEPSTLLLLILCGTGLLIRNRKRIQ